MDQIHACGQRRMRAAMLKGNSAAKPIACQQVAGTQVTKLLDAEHKHQSGTDSTQVSINM
jgi:hypothetical protein